MSKSFALAGLRIGWIACRDESILRRVASFKDYTSICNAVTSEVLAIIALRARERVLARSREIVAANLERLDRFFLEWSSTFSWVRPRGGSIGFPLLKAKAPIETFADALVRAQGVLLLPGPRLGHFGNHFRIGFGRTDLDQGLAKLASFCRAEGLE